VIVTTTRGFLAREKRPTAAPPIELEGRRFRFVASDESVDADGDVVVQSGWMLERFMQNPVVLALHERRALPVGRVVDLAVAGRQLRGILQFPGGDDMTAASREVYGLVRAGALRGVSVAFRGLEWEDLPTGGHRFTQQELLEISLVSIGSNANAVVKHRARGPRRAGLRLARPGAKRTPAPVVVPIARKRISKALTPLVAVLVRRQVKAAVGDAVRRARGRLCDCPAPCSCDT